MLQQLASYTTSWQTVTAQILILSLQNSLQKKHRNPQIQVQKGTTLRDMQGGKKWQENGAEGDG